ncbi:substrate-binding domain-containing protein [Rubritalea tangerina]|uniref:Substrate-binding domain-containing protein n=1 Tax=Rubritalea tangerina TaxID=430798 RepID=A0ABW4Z8M1_9BACT
MQAPKKISLATQAAEILRQQILDGKFADILPGETPLSTSLRVSRKTIREALTILEGEKLISPAEPGKRRSITLPKSHTKTPAQELEVIRILLPQPLKQMHASAQHLFTSLIQHLPALEENIYFHNLPYTSAKLDIRPRIEELIKSHRATLWIVYELNSEVAEVMRANNKQVIACGGNVKAEFPVVAYDSASATSHAINKLLLNGHRRIVRPLTHHAQSSTHMEEVMLKAGIPVQKEFNFPHYQGSTESLQKLLHRLFLHPNPPTAFITSGPKELITLITWLASRKLSIPEDVSLLHIGSDPLLEAFVPKIGYYSTRGGPLIREIARLSTIALENPSKKLNHKFFFMDYEPGESIRNISI